MTISDADDEQLLEPGSFTLGGTVTGLEGSGLVLDNQGERLTIDENGPFAFSTALPSGREYDVSVVTRPDSPDQECSVANGTGRIDGADVTDIVVECSTPEPVSGLDESFDGDGRASVPGTGTAEAVVVQPDGMVVAAGGGSDFTLSLHDTHGVADGNFGDGGVVTTDLGGDDQALDAVLQAAYEKIVVVGESAGDFAVVRYRPNGIPDEEFGGGDGIVTTDFGGRADVATSVVLQSDGGIVVAGHAQVEGRFGLVGSDFAVARYRADGSPDTSFGPNGDGTVTTDLGSSSDLGNDVALDTEDRIVVGGQIDQGDDMALVRYTPDGDVDTSFEGGIVIADFGRCEAINGIAIRSDGTIVVAGESDSHERALDFANDFALAMFDGAGSLDTSIGRAGLVTTDLSANQEWAEDFGEDLALDSQERIVVVGRNTSDTFNDLALVRYLRDGTVDTSFGGGDGVLLTDFHGTGDAGQDVAIQADGRIVAAGLAGSVGFGLARALP